MKILYLVQQFPKKTSETFILSEMIALQKMGHDVWVLTDFINHTDMKDSHSLISENNFMSKVVEVDCYRRGLFKLGDFVKKVFFDFFRNPIACVHSLLIAFYPLFSRRYFNVWDKLDNYLILNKIFKIKFDYVYSPFAPVEKIRRGLMIAHAYCVPFSCAFRALEMYGEKYEKNIVENKNLYNKVSGFVTISEQNKRNLIEKLGFKKTISVIHSSIDPEKFIRSNEKKDEEVFSIITIARFVEKKGIVYLLEALANLKKQNYRFFYTLVGAGPLKDVYQEKIKDLGISDCVLVLEPMNQEKIKNLLDKSDTLVLPCVIADNGDRDILANVLKEAMAMELPVITSNISGIEELIEDGKSGLLVPEKDSGALEDAIKRLIINPELRRDLGINGRKKIIEDFSVQKVSQKLNSFFITTLNQFKVANFSKYSYKGSSKTELKNSENEDWDFFYEVVNKCEGMMVVPVYRAIYKKSFLADDGNMLELGSRYGAATVCIAKGIKDSKKTGKLFAFESGGGVASSLSQLGTKEDNILKLESNIKKFNFEDKVEIISAQIGKADAILDKELTFSLLLIDADGKLDRDFILFYNRLSPGAVIIIDDYENSASIEKSTDNNPLGKSYATYRFVEYFLKKGFIKKEFKVEHTLFCVKPKNIKKTVVFNQLDFQKIRQSIIDEFNELQTK